MLIETPLPIALLEGVIAVGTILEVIVLIRKWLGKRKETPTLKREKRDYVWGVIYSVICALLWSLSYVSLSYVSARATLLDINIVLLGTGSLFLFLGWCLCYLYERTAGVQPKLNINWKSVTPWIVVVMNLSGFLLFIYALDFISASQTITLQKTNPLFVAILSVLWLKKKTSKSTVAAVLLVTLGAILILVNDQFHLTESPALIGSLIAIGAGASFAVFSVGLEKLEEPKMSPTEALGFMSLVFIISYLGIVTVGFIYGRGPSLSFPVIMILIGNGLRVALVYALYQAAVRRMGALLASAIVALEVPFTMLWDYKLLHNTPGGRLAIGALAILFGAIALVWDRIMGAEPKTPQPVTA